MWTPRSTLRLLCESQIIPAFCIFPPATWLARAMVVSEKPCAPITLRRESPTLMRKSSGARCTTWSSRRNNWQIVRTVTQELRQQALSKEHAAKDLGGAALDNQIRKNRFRWLREYLTEAGMKRAAELGWPNTYTLTKSLAESLIAKNGAGLPIAIVRPAIVETSVAEPFVGWNEGINTSASLSYLLGTSFRQLPTNEKKRLDIIPVDSVCRGMTLIGAAIVEDVTNRSINWPPLSPIPATCGVPSN